MRNKRAKLLKKAAKVIALSDPDVDWKRLYKFMKRQYTRGY